MLRAISFVALLLAAQAALALDISTVNPSAVKGARQADFSFGPLMVKGISYGDGAVVLPVTDNKGKKYSDIKLLSKALYGRIEACFKDGCARPAMPAAMPAVKVSKLKPLRSKARVANAEITFDGELLVVAGVMASRREEGAFWVAFPPGLEFPDKAFKSSVESAVIAAWTGKGKK